MIFLVVFCPHGKAIEYDPAPLPSSPIEKETVVNFVKDVLFVDMLNLLTLTDKFRLTHKNAERV